MSYTYPICPICQNPLKLINGVYVCYVCGYRLTYRRSKYRVELKALATT